MNAVRPRKAKCGGYLYVGLLRVTASNGETDFKLPLSSERKSLTRPQGNRYTMDDMETSILYLEEELVCREKSCRAWCTKEELEFTTGARLAHCILNFLTSMDGDYGPPARILPRPSRDEAAWRTLAEWRHPKINLNLLQLATVFIAYDKEKYLWQPVFLEEQDYRDANSQLVNHPVHLLYGLRKELVNKLDLLRDEVFFEEGLVDLTPSRVLNLTDTQSDDATSGVPKASLMDSDISPLFQEALLRLERLGKVAKNNNPFQQPKSIRLASLYDVEYAFNVVQRLSESLAQPSTVELVWTIAASTTSASHSGTPLLRCFASIPPEHLQELLILLCQSIFTAIDPKRREVRLDHLSEFFWRNFLQPKVSTEKAARFLSRNALEEIIRLLRMKDAVCSQRGRICPSLLPSQVLEDQLVCRSLQDLCVLTVLEAVRGDARKVWSLEQLPEPVKQLFHIPFQETYEELTARE